MFRIESKSPMDADWEEREKEIMRVWPECPGSHEKGAASEWDCETQGHIPGVDGVCTVCADGCEDVEVYGSDGEEGRSDDSEAVQRRADDLQNAASDRALMLEVERLKAACRVLRDCGVSVEEKAVKDAACAFLRRQFEVDC